MITKVVIENFKRFGRQEFDLDETIVLAGPRGAIRAADVRAVLDRIAELIPQRCDRETDEQE